MYEPMALIRFSLQPQTEGLTTCTVLIPRPFNFLWKNILKSGESTPIKISIFSFEKSVKSFFLMESNFGSLSKGSTSPITCKSWWFTPSGVEIPREFTCGPPKPKISTSSRFFNDLRRLAPNLSPECSAAMMPIFNFLLDTYRNKPL